MHAGVETGGVACRTYLHTLVALLALEERLAGVDLRLGERVRRSAAAIAYLLDRRDGWLPPVLEAIDGTEGVWLLAPAERIGIGIAGCVDGPRRARAVLPTVARRATGTTSTCTSPRRSTTARCCSPVRGSMPTRCDG